LNSSTAALAHLAVLVANILTNCIWNFFGAYLTTYIEPKIFQIIENISSQLKEYDLYVSNADFGFSDATYELVISKIGTEPNIK
jgi:hypothetical protein